MSTRRLTDPRNGSVRTGGGDIDTSMDRLIKLGFDVILPTPADYFLSSALGLDGSVGHQTIVLSTKPRSLGRC